MFLEIILTVTKVCRPGVYVSVNDDQWSVLRFKPAPKGSKQTFNVDADMMETFNFDDQLQLKLAGGNLKVNESRYIEADESAAAHRSTLTSVGPREMVTGYLRTLSWNQEYKCKTESNWWHMVFLDGRPYIEYRDPASNWSLSYDAVWKFVHVEDLQVRSFFKDKRKKYQRIIICKDVEFGPFGCLFTLPGPGSEETPRRTDAWKLKKFLTCICTPRT
jgi:hypothetical protein